jgi:FtsP/CotA-like multicopper oxidase with cupredoxin domain
VHWHGLIVPCGMDGVGGLTQRSIEPGETFRYEFVLRQHGTFLYHSHHDEMTQMAMGLSGMFVVHPRRPTNRVPIATSSTCSASGRSWSAPNGRIRTR